MDLWDDKETRLILEKIKGDARALTSKEVLAALTTAKKNKPPRFDEVSCKTRDLYLGDSRQLLISALAEAFPNTKPFEFPLDALPLMHMYATIDAGVYARAPDRWLEDEDGKRAGEDAAKLWSTALTKSLFNSQMQECERRMLIPPRCVVGEIVWEIDPDTGEAVPRVNLYWPGDVDVICHWQASTSWKHKWLVMLRQAKPTPAAEGNWFKVYSREPPDELGGKWGPIFVQTVSDKGEQAQLSSTPVKYDGKRWPLFLMQPPSTAGGIFSFIDPDMVDVVLNLNVQRADEGYTLRRQGHTQTWTDDISELAQVASGAGVMWRVNKGHTIQSITYNAPLAGHFESRRMRQRETAIARGNSPHAYDDMGSVPPSGEAKKVDNAKHDELVQQNADVFEVLEEEGPLAVLLDVLQTFHPKRALLVGLKPRMRTKRAPTIENPSQKQDRMAKAADRGWISDARAAVEADFYDTEDEAQEAIDEIEAETPEPPVPPPMPPPPSPPDGDMSKKTTQNGDGNGPGEAGSQDGPGSGEPKPGAG